MAREGHRADFSDRRERTRVRPGVVHRLPLSPERLPAVSARDLRRAFEAAREVAREGEAQPVRLFSCGRGEAAVLLFVDDPSASAWIGGIERLFGLSSPYALALCFRVLALIERLARPEARALFPRRPLDCDALPARLLHAAAIAPLDGNGQFRESDLPVG